MPKPILTATVASVRRVAEQKKREQNARVSDDLASEME
jgi:hypothetical protein